MALSKDEVKARVEEQVRNGSFFFPEDVVRGIAEAFGIDTEGTVLGQVAPANSPTRGDVHPDPEESIEYVRTTSRKAAGKEDLPEAEDPGLETTVEGGSSDDDEGYNADTVEDLKEELRSRDLPTSGSKAELVARLEADDKGE